MKPGTSKRMVTLPQGPVCPVCNGDGVVWSERSLQMWEEQTPWFDREKMTPTPPQSWKDKLCVRCCGAGMLDATTGEPLWGRLIPSAVPKHVRQLLAATGRKRGGRVSAKRGGRRRQSPAGLRGGRDALAEVRNRGGRPLAMESHS